MSTTNAVLNPERVNTIFLTCMYNEGEDTRNHVMAECVITDVGFHPERLQEHKEEVEAMLDELPDNFKKSIGGGWSFLEACNDKHGNRWTIV